MSETIRIGGEDYEVLTLDRISEITHARLAGGKVVEAFCSGYGIVRTNSPTGQYAQTLLGLEELEPFGIQPLKLIERVPVEVIGKFTGVEVYEDYEVAQFMVPLGTSKAIGRKINMKLAQITEEA